MKVIRNFASLYDLATLRELAKKCIPYEGTRPDIYEVSTIYNIPADLYQRLIVASELPGAKLKGEVYRQFIIYKKDGFIHPHKDWVWDRAFSKHLNTDADKANNPACKLYRVNIMVDAASQGGECFVDGVEVTLEEGDALVIRADIEKHEVKKITEGNRMIFTIGFHHKEE